ncbi:MAG: hypothetical protein ACFCVD_00270 [Nodosilinea sp.]
MVDKIIPTALRIWLVSLFTFLLLGYGVLPSIFFGAVAGLAAGVMSAWWKTPGGEPKVLELPEPIRQFSRQIRETPSRLPFRSFFERGNKRYSRPKR